MHHNLGNKLWPMYSHTLPNNSRCKGNPTMKFGHLIEYIMANILFQKNHTQNMVEKLFPDPFLKDQNLWINSLKLSKVCFYCMPSWCLSKFIEIELQTTCFFKKWEGGLELVPLFHLTFEEIYFSCYIFLTNQI